MRTLVRPVAAVLFCLSSLLALAKCPPLFVTLQQFGGGISTSQYPDTTWDGGMGWNETYAPFTLAPGDSINISFGMAWSCFPLNRVWHNGILIFQSTALQCLKRVAAPGSYIAESCDEGCNFVQFQITGNSGTGGPVGINLSAMLEGAMDDGEMLANLPWNTFLTPWAEPYTQAGFTQVHGGGEQMLASAIPVQWWGATRFIDWILVELRDAAQPSTISCTKSVLLLNDGRAVDPTTFNTVWLDAPPGNYYVAVRHRNHMGAMTATPLSLGATPVTVDFRDPALPTWGANARAIGGNIALLRMGNVNRTGAMQQVKYSGLNNDRDPILVKIGGTVPTASVSGYFVEDVNLDGVVKYTGAGNDRDLILQAIGGAVPTAVVTEQIP